MFSVSLSLLGSSPRALLSHCTRTRTLARPARALAAQAGMSSTHPRSRSATPSGISPPPVKKQRIDAPPAETAEHVQIQDAPAAYQTEPPPSDPPTTKGKKATKNKKNKKNARRAPEPFSSDDILTREVIALLGQEYVDNATSQNIDWDAPFEQSTQLELTVSCISPSTGQFIARCS